MMDRGCIGRQVLSLKICYPSRIQELNSRNCSTDGKDKVVVLPATHPICIFLDFIKVIGKEAVVSVMAGDAPFRVDL